MDVQDERIVLGPALGQKDLLHSLRIQPVGPQPVDRLGGNAHQAAGFNQCGGSFEVVFTCR